MGIKQNDLVPIGTVMPTAQSPAPKDGALRFFQLARTETTGVLKCVLPGNASILGFLIWGVASNAGTTATISIGSTSANANEYVNGQSVLTGGLVIPTASLSTNLPNIEPIPATGQDIYLYAKYAETGAASSAGGPWKIAVWYAV